MFSGLVTVVLYVVILAGVYKLFQVASDLSEIKDVLQDIRRNTHDVIAPGSVHAPEALLRAVNAESYPPPAPRPDIFESQS
jgi:hypothetical protein